MKENEFDIYVRNLLSGAEESVSPDLWEGVEAGLDRLAAPRRTVPLWVWRSLAGTGIAAAIAAAFVLLRPAENLSNQPTIQNPVALAAADDTLPAEANQPEEEAVLPVARQAERLSRRLAYVPEPVAPVTEEAPVAEEVPVQEEATAKPDAVIAPAVSRQEQFSGDDDALRQLAFEEHKTRRKGQLSMSVLGTLQSNARPKNPTSTVRRTAGAPVLRTPTATGIQDERPEFSFGLPVSAGITFRYDFNPRWGIGTGLVYTNLSRSFMGIYSEVGNDGSVLKQNYTDVSNQLHYVGIPLNVFYNIVNNGNWNFHVRMDGMAEKAVDNHFIIHDSDGDVHLHQKVGGLQFSAGVGVGLEFKFTPAVSIYFDPTLRYYFDGNQPRSLRTIQPLRMDFEAGVRFSFGQ